MTAIGQKISLALKGRKKSPEHVEKVRRALTGRTLSSEHCVKLSEAHKGKRQSPAHAAAAAKARTGLKRSDEFKAKMRVIKLDHNPMRGKTGEAHHNWIADRTKLRRSATSRSEAHLYWSRQIRKRFPTCVLGHLGGCGGRNESHHIKPYAQYPELRFDVRNGVTLCQRHHPKGQREAENIEQLLLELAHKKG